MIEEPAAPVPPLEWATNPWSDQPLRAGLGAVLALAGCVLVLSLREPAVVSIGLCIAVAAAFAPLYVPAQCRLGADGAAVRGALGWTRRGWSEIRRAVPGPRGVLLSPYAAPHWLDAARALYLPFPSAHREQLRSGAREWLEAHGHAR